MVVRDAVTERLGSLQNVSTGSDVRSITIALQRELPVGGARAMLRAFSKRGELVGTTTTLVGLKRWGSMPLCKLRPAAYLAHPHTRAHERPPSGTSSGAPLRHNAIFVYIEMVCLHGGAFDALALASISTLNSLWLSRNRP